MQTLTTRLAILAALVLLPTSSALAETLCRCAYPSLEATLCDDDLTAKVFVWSGYTDGQTGNNVYYATVQEVFHGDAGRVITIEAPRSCGFELRTWTSYGVSLNRDDNGRYTTFACGSWVKPWRQVTREERQTLSAPSCAPTCDDVTCGAGEVCELQQVMCIRAPCPPMPVCVPGPQAGACYDYSGMDFGSCKMLMGWAVQDGTCRPIGGCGADVPFHASLEACMASCAVPQGGTCYSFVETNADTFVNRPCEDGLKCTATSSMFGFNSARQCQPMNFCIDDSTAATDCAELPHIAVPGKWGCESNACTWRTGPQI